MSVKEYKLNDLKTAVINRDLEKIKRLSKQTPKFSSIDEAKELLSYIEMAKSILQEEKNKLSKEMEKIKKLKKFQSSKESVYFFNNKF